MNWDDLRLLLAVSRRGSFLQAGDALGIAASTLSRRITQLETALGDLLVERAADGTRLTSRGLALVEVALHMESELSRNTPSASLSGTVRVSAGDGFIGPVNAATAEFTEKHPLCSVDITLTTDFLKVARNVADVALRTVHLGEPSLIYQRLTPAAFGVFASPDHAAGLPDGPRPSDAAMIDLMPPLDHLAHLRAARAAGFSAVRFRVSSFTAQLAAVQAGYGVAVLPRALAGGLVEPFGVIDLPPLDIFLTTRREALRQPHIRAYIDILRGKVNGA